MVREGGNMSLLERLNNDMKQAMKNKEKDKLSVIRMLKAALQNEAIKLGNKGLTEDEELNSFLFSLGCYSGEPITVISHKKGGCVVSIKDARYNIDNELAQAISI